ncbi:hypothetical protein C8Q80DRAFT_1167585 [Daedaleopsis nitida]|nr:hypothetical protein C8Q80DRAFT_1167585 [Daedaleopsis nitida]
MSTLPTVEIVCAPATDAVRTDPHNRELVKTTFSILQQQEGLQRIYYGLQLEDQKTCYHFVVWETLEHHQKLMSNPETYPKLTGSVGPIFEGGASKIEMIHVKPTTEPFRAFEAPALELAVFTLLEGQPMSALEEIVGDLVKAVSTGEPEVIHASWGHVVEKADQLALFIGWTSVEAHWSTVNGNPAKYAGIRERCKPIGTVTVQHIALAVY